jgi:hypothetical protein
MAQIDATIISAIRSEKQTTIVVEFQDAKGTWQKTYKSNEEKIKADKFKEMVAADLRKDLKKEEQLTEIEPLIGKKFVIKI